ncbi:MAG: PUR family DNA/RNA-binding protein [Flavobacteriales bacterium]|nr:PUR family DNA/RNA-binding protein [Flavobacteriales bacterium]
MEGHDSKSQEIFSKILRAGRRTYFFDVRSTRADDYYLTITESKKHTNDDGSAYYKKHKIYLYKEDFLRFKDIFDEVTKFIIDEKGEEIISDYEPNPSIPDTDDDKKDKDTSSFTNIEFEDI